MGESNMTTFMDFRPFFNAMIKKMRAKDEEKGDSWREEHWNTDVPARGEARFMQFSVNDILRKELKKETMEYFRSLDADELPDIANYCAMLYIRKKTLFPDQN